MIRKKNKKLFNLLKIKNLFFNLTLIFLIVLILGFIWSFISNINNKNKITYDKSIELQKLLKINNYESKTGYRIKVELLNGCGISGLADKYSNFFRENGFDVVLSKNAPHFNYEKSQVILRQGDKEIAIETASFLDINPGEIIEKINDQLNCDVTIILGKDFNQLSSFKKALELSPPY